LKFYYLSSQKLYFNYFFTLSDTFAKKINRAALLHYWQQLKKVVKDQNNFWKLENNNFFLVYWGYIWKISALLVITNKYLNYLSHFKFIWLFGVYKYEIPASFLASVCRNVCAKVPNAGTKRPKSHPWIKSGVDVSLAASVPRLLLCIFETKKLFFFVRFLSEQY